MTETLEAPEARWAQPIKRLRAPKPPSGVLNLNVDGRRLNGAMQGFGQLWQRTYRIPLNSQLRPEQVVQTWREHFSEFWPEGNRFFEPSPRVVPGDVALINLTPLPGPLTLSTGIAVIYADDTSFTFMAPEGHMYAGWITFSSHVTDAGVTCAQVEVLVRTSDPAWEIVMRLFAFRLEDAFWRATLTRLASSFGIWDQPVEQNLSLLDSRVQWRRATNVWRNAAMWSGIHQASEPLRFGARLIRR